MTTDPAFNARIEQMVPQVRYPGGRGAQPNGLGHLGAYRYQLTVTRLASMELTPFCP